MCIQGVKKTIFIDGYITLHFQVSYVTFKPEMVYNYQNHQYIEKEYTFLNGIKKNRFYIFYLL